MKNTTNEGFTLIELMIVVAILAILAAAAVPVLTSSRLAAQESSAISTLRRLHSAQAEFWSQKAVDDDRDGAGEFGYFSELAGFTNLNSRINGNGPAAPLEPPILGNRFGIVDGVGALSMSGYEFQIFLPNGLGTGVPEAALGGPSGLEDADNCETMWCAYAYPTVAGSSGNRAFFINQRGEILQTQMDVLTYDQSAGGPGWDAVFNLVGGNMGDPVGIGALPATDGNRWVVVN